MFINLKFDTTDLILIKKAENIVLRDVVQNLIRNHLNNRKQHIEFRNDKSLTDVICGVPQGSIHGLLLFIMYINDIYTALENINFVLYTEDTTFNTTYDTDILSNKRSGWLQTICFINFFMLVMLFVDTAR